MVIVVQMHPWVVQAPAFGNNAGRGGKYLSSSVIIKVREINVDGWSDMEYEDVGETLWRVADLKSRKQLLISACIALNLSSG